MRATGRVTQFSNRVTEGFQIEFRRIAERDGLLLAELLERCLESYKRENPDL